MTATAIKNFLMSVIIGQKDGGESDIISLIISDNDYKIYATPQGTYLSH